MRKSVFILFTLLIIVNSSCKNTEEKPVIETVKEEISIPKYLTINFSFKTNKADTFRIMLNNIEVDALQKKNIHILEDVVPSSEADAIIARFDANNFSNNVVINLGNKEVKEVTIQELSVSFGNNQINIKTPTDIDKYLAFNKFIERDTTSNTLKTKKINGQHNPAFSLKRNLINALKKE